VYYAQVIIIQRCKFIRPTKFTKIWTFSSTKFQSCAKQLNLRSALWGCRETMRRELLHGLDIQGNQPREWSFVVAWQLLKTRVFHVRRIVILIFLIKMFIALYVVLYYKKNLSKNLSGAIMLIHSGNENWETRNCVELCVFPIWITITVSLFSTREQLKNKQ
jgi:hypothetical protein